MATKKKLFELSVFKRTEKQPMLSLDGDGKQDIFSAGDVAEGVHLGKKTGLQLRLDCRYMDKEFSLIHGDTHNLWQSHQDGEGKAVFDKIYSGLTLGQHVVLEVLRVEQVKAAAKEAAVSI